jgi:two-component system response regulator HydG
MKKILIVDDEFEFVNDLAEGLEILGYEAYKAGDGNGALRVIEKVRPDIVLCDYKLPDMDGDIILKKTKAQYPDIRFIIVTAYYDEELEQRFKKLGADEIIFKPIVLTDVEAILQKP